MSVGIKVAVCQACPQREDVEANTRKVITWIGKAAKSGADVVLFGELFLTDYDLRLSAIKSLSQAKDGPAAKAIASAAKEMKISVAYGYSEFDNGCYFNSLLFIDSNGETLANYRKVHLWPGEEQMCFTPGDKMTVVAWNGMKVGLAICVDICMPEYIATMAGSCGAQLVVVANALVDSPQYERTPLLLVPARALENRCYIAYVDLAGERYSGMSRVYSPDAECLVSVKTNDEVMLMSTVYPNASQNAPFHYHNLRRPYSIPYNEVPSSKTESKSVDDYYNNRAYYYDRQMQGIYNGPKITSEFLSALVLDKKKRVLDVAAGTGLVGQALFYEGFTNITALDRNEQMLEHARNKKVYSQIIHSAFEEAVDDLQTCQPFHACVCIGGFITEGFLDSVVAVKGMVSIVETGGYILLLYKSARANEPERRSTYEKLDKVCIEVVEDGLCECLEKKTVPNYLPECDGMLRIFRKVA